MFRRFFGGKKVEQPAGYAEGWKLFELGMAHASRFDCDKALDYYARSIVACNNPAPYINRANILSKRIRYKEALQDLLTARRLDEAQGKEMGAVLQREISAAETVTHLWRDGTREKLLDDLEQNGIQHVAGKIYCASFGCKHVLWEAGRVPPPYAEYHFYNELDNIQKFDRLGDYPQASAYLKLYPQQVIGRMLTDIPDWENYRMGEVKLHSFLCIYDLKTMQRLRQAILYALHEKLLSRDYPRTLPLTAQRPEILKSAYRVIHGRDYSPGDAAEEPEAELAGHDEEEQPLQVASGVDIAGVSIVGDLNDPDTVLEIVTKLSLKVAELATSELDLYRYIVEEAERFSCGGNVETNILRAAGVSPVEYEGQIARSGDYPKNRVALDYMEWEISPGLGELIGIARTEEIRAYIFANIFLRDENILEMLKLRLKYAVQFCNSALAGGNWASHDRWSAVVDQLEAAVEMHGRKNSSASG